jgi:hypothetical protein
MPAIVSLDPLIPKQRSLAAIDRPSLRRKPVTTATAARVRA